MMKRYNIEDVQYKKTIYHDYKDIRSFNCYIYYLV